MGDKTAPEEDEQAKAYISRVLKLKEEVLAAKHKNIMKDKEYLQLAEELLLLKTKLNDADQDKWVLEEEIALLRKEIVLLEETNFGMQRGSLQPKSQ